MAIGHELKRGTAERERIDTDMRREALVFVGKEQLQKARIDVLPRGRQSPTAFIGRIGAQQPAVAVEHDVRIFEILAERRGPERLRPERAGKQRDGRGAAQACKDNAPALHFGAISTVPVAVRPNRSGRYMSSTFACGNT